MDDIYIALYDLACANDQVLKFKRGDRFIRLSYKNLDGNWIVCVDRHANIGYIPSSYVHSEKVPKQEQISFIDNILENLSSRCHTAYSKEQRQIIQELSCRRTELIESQIHSASENLNVPAAAYLAEHNGNGLDASLEVNSPDFKSCPNKTVVNSTVQILTKNEEPLTFERSKNASNKLSQTSPIEKHDSVEQVVSSAYEDPLESSIAAASCIKSEVEETCLKNVKAEIPIWLVPSLIERIRCETRLSHENSKVAVSVVLCTLGEALPNLEKLWNELKENLKQLDTIKEDADNIVESEDKWKLLHIFKQLWYCKNDEQQRSWPVHEDEGMIASLLEDLNRILIDANPRISKDLVQKDEYEIVNLLVTYYQMEPRRLLRLRMLNVFYSLCELDFKVVNQLLYSVLPMEFARDMLSTSEDVEKLQITALMLTIIFCTGQKPPNGIYEFLNKKFLDFVFEKFEEFTLNGDDDTGNQLLTIILSFNLHFQDDIRENLVLQVIKERQDARILSEKLIFLLNREDDPTKILKHELEAPNSILKIMVDIFSSPDLSQLFYLNDLKVLLDIIVRQLTDFFPGEKRRMWYLELVRNIIRNCNYEEHYHQQQGLQKCFNTVLTQEFPCAAETMLVKSILEEFAEWFTSPKM